MAQLSGRRALHLSGWAGCGLALLFSAASALAEVELDGTWHVLVHYTDEAAHDPGQLRWDDRVWAFTPKGDRLEWTEYPIVVFSDESGRFERRSTGQYARVVGAWEPNESQQSDIASGLKTNSRGVKKKSLRRSATGGWATRSRSRPTSVSVVTYQENWSVEGLAELPVFVQQDLMGSARTEMLEGVTRYQVTAIEEQGRVLVGDYERDGTRHGTFRMTRSGPVGQLEEKTQQQLRERGLRPGPPGVEPVDDEP